MLTSPSKAIITEGMMHSLWSDIKTRQRMLSLFSPYDATQKREIKSYLNADSYHPLLLNFSFEERSDMAKMYAVVQTHLDEVLDLIIHTSKYTELEKEIMAYSVYDSVSVESNFLALGILRGKKWTREIYQLHMKKPDTYKQLKTAVKKIGVFERGVFTEVPSYKEVDGDLCAVVFHLLNCPPIVNKTGTSLNEVLKEALLKLEQPILSKISDEEIENMDVLDSPRKLFKLACDNGGNVKTGEELLWAMKNIPNSCMNFQVTAYVRSSISEQTVSDLTIMSCFETCASSNPLTTRILNEKISKSERNSALSFSINYWYKYVTMMENFVRYNDETNNNTPFDIDAYPNLPNDLKYITNNTEKEANFASLFDKERENYEGATEEEIESNRRFLKYLSSDIKHVVNRILSTYFSALLYMLLSKVHFKDVADGILSAIYNEKTGEEKTELKKVTETISSLNKDLNFSNEERKKLETENKTLKKDLERMKDSARNKENKNQIIEQQKAQNKKLQNEIERLQTKIKTLSSDSDYYEDFLDDEISDEDVEEELSNEEVHERLSQLLNKYKVLLVDGHPNFSQRLTEAQPEIKTFLDGHAPGLSLAICNADYVLCKSRAYGSHKMSVRAQKLAQTKGIPFAFLSAGTNIQQSEREIYQLIEALDTVKTEPDKEEEAF